MEGKRIRPQLVLLMAETLEVDVSQKTIDLMAASGELIHCYSLIHDDCLLWMMMISEEESFLVIKNLTKLQQY